MLKYLMIFFISFELKAYDENDLLKLNNTNICLNCDFRIKPKNFVVFSSITFEISSGG